MNLKSITQGTNRNPGRRSGSLCLLQVLLPSSGSHWTQLASLPSPAGPHLPPGSSCQPAHPSGPEQQGMQQPHQVPCLNIEEILAAEVALQ